jgi:hypothetical protein
LHRFDLEHTFRLFKQVLGWTAPKIRDPQAAPRPRAETPATRLTPWPLNASHAGRVKSTQAASTLTA